jgi:acyl-CoA thioesterase-1
LGARSGSSRQHYFLLLGCALAGSAALALACGEPEPQPPAQPLSVRAAATPAAGEPAAELPVVLFLGTSLTAGYGLPSEEAFPSLVQGRIDAAALPYRVVNAGVSGDTSAGGLRRLDWLLRMPVAVLVLELGANDMLRGLGIEAMRQNLRTILERTREAHPRARFVIAGMRAAPNLGAAYGREFDATFPALAERYDAAFVPFLLDGVAAVRRLNQPDGIHPTAEGHRILANTIWSALEPVLRED